MQPIVMCGIPRSGSTLIWQIFQAVFPEQELPRTHPAAWDYDEVMAIISIRDPRDIAASLLRVRLSREGRKEINSNDVEVVLNRTKFYFDGLENVMTGPYTLLRYEDFYNDHSIIYNMITDIFGIAIPFDIREQLSNKFSVECNKQRAGVLKNFYEIGEYEIHGDHIGHVIPGYWKDYFPEWSLGQVKTFCKPLCEDWNYEDK